MGDGDAAAVADNNGRLRNCCARPVGEAGQIACSMPLDKILSLLVSNASGRLVGPELNFSMNCFTGDTGAVEGDGEFDGTVLVTLSTDNLVRPVFERGVVGGLTGLVRLLSVDMRRCCCCTTPSPNLPPGVEGVLKARGTRSMDFLRAGEGERVVGWRRDGDGEDSVVVNFFETLLFGVTGTVVADSSVDLRRLGEDGLL